MPSGETTQLLVESRGGDREALDRLFPHVYEELKVIAHGRLARYRRGETIDTTVLVHETYVKLIDGERSGWNDRAHFFAVASRAMRFILVDYARAQSSQKRGGDRSAITIADHHAVEDARSLEDLIALSEAMEQLAEYSERLSQTVECRFFGGLKLEEIAEVTGQSLATVKRDLARARTWLYDFMQGDS